MTFCPRGRQPLLPRQASWGDLLSDYQVIIMMAIKMVIMTIIMVIKMIISIMMMIMMTTMIMTVVTITLRGKRFGK